MQRLLLIITSVLVMLANCEGEEHQRIPEVNRYFNDEGSIGDYIPDEMKGYMTKRRQFYAWAGKRALPFDKRRQFYAWAGK